MAEKEKDQEKQKKPKGEALHPEAQKAKARKAKAAAAEKEQEVDDGAPAQPAPPARLYERYKSEIVPALQQKLGTSNKFAVPRLEKIVISMGLGRFAVEGGEGKAKFQQAEKELQTIAGQKPVRFPCLREP